MRSQVVTSAGVVGPQQPTMTTPDRLAGSLRRTSNVDVVRPDGAAGPVQIVGRSRDLRTEATGTVRILAERELQATLDPTQELRTITTEPFEPALARLVGRRVASGFRAAAAEAVPDSRRRSDLLYLMLDDLPVATLVSGYALQRAGLIPDVPRAMYAPTVDLCSGWRAGGTLMQVLDSSGVPPMTLGPPAPVLERPDDPDGWHLLPQAAPHTVRRRRRIDVTVGEVLRVDAMFRDSHFDADRRETVVHEYTVLAAIDPTSLVITDIEATPRVLPYQECPAAAASASRLVGLHLDQIRDRVRADFVGTSTCTHLNDLFRSLEDVGGLWKSFRTAETM